MFKILHARLQQYMNSELPDVEAGFRKGRGTRDQLANICWIIEKARQKNIYFSVDVSDTIQPSHPLLSPSPPALNLSQHQGLFQ